MKIGLGIGINNPRRGGGAPAIITATTEPSLGPLTDGDVLEDQLSAGIADLSNYQSTAGNIVSVEVRAFKDGVDQGVIAPSVAGFLLDDYPGAAFAYSLRQLSSTTTHVARVQRSSDNAEDDFTASEITDGTLTAWVGAGNDGLVVTRYDQSGNGRNATQSTVASQMKVVDNGALVTENGKPVMLHDGVDDGYAFTPSGAIIDDVLIVSAQVATSSSASRLLSMSNSNTGVDDFQRDGLIVGRTLFTFGKVGGGAADPPPRVDTPEPPLNELYLRSHQANSTAFNVRENGSVIGSRTPSAENISPDRASIGYSSHASPGSSSWIGAMGDLICYTSDQSANVTAIEQEVAGYYGITL